MLGTTKENLDSNSVHLLKITYLSTWTHLLGNSLSVHCFSLISIKVLYVLQKTLLTRQ